MARTSILMLVAFTLFLGASASAVPNTVCKSFRVCSSKGAAWASVDIYTALEPLFEQQRLAPLSQYVEVVKADRVTGCECASPVEVQISLPISHGGAIDSLVDTLSQFVANLQLPGAVCVSPLVDVQCAELVSMVAQRRRLSQVTAMEQSAPAPVPTMELAPEEQAAAAQSLDAQTGGYGYYGYGTQERAGYYGYGESAGGYYGSSDMLNRRSALEAEYQAVAAAGPQVQSLDLPAIPLPVRSHTEQAPQRLAGKFAPSATVQDTMAQLYQPRQSTLLLTVMAGSVAVGLAAAGAVMLVAYFFDRRNDAAAPLLANY